MLLVGKGILTGFQMELILTGLLGIFQASHMILLIIVCGHVVMVELLLERQELMNIGVMEAGISLQQGLRILRILREQE